MNINSKIIQNNYSSLNPGYQKNNSSMPKLQAGRNLNSTDQFVSSNKKNKQQVSFSGMPGVGEVSHLLSMHDVILGVIDIFCIYIACRREVKDSDRDREIRDGKFVRGAFFNEGPKTPECNVPKYYASINEGLKIAKDEAKKRGIKIDQPEGFLSKAEAKLRSKIGMKPKEENIYAKAVRVLAQVQESSTEGILGKEHFSGETFEVLNKKSALKNNGPAGITEACGNIIDHIVQITSYGKVDANFMSRASIYLNPLIDDVKALKESFEKVSGAALKVVETGVQTAAKPEIVGKAAKIATSLASTLPKL